MSAALKLVPPSRHDARETDDFSAPMESGIAPRYQRDELTELLADAGLDVDAFEFFCCSPVSSARSSIRDLDRTYRCWSRLQEEMHRELGAAWSGTSDEFSRQDEWCCLLYGGKVISVSAFRWVDMRAATSHDDSYFKCWPAEARQELVDSFGPEICITSNFAVDEAWRGRIGPLSVKELVVRLIVERSNRSPSGAMIVTVRNSKGMNRVLYEVGARPLVKDLVHPHFNAAIDLVAVPRRDEPERVTPDLMGTFARRLWQNFEQKDISDASALVG